MNRRDRKILKSIAKLSERLAEDQLYQIVSDELEEGFVDGVASLRANEIAEGNREKAESIYPKQRIRRLLDLRSEFALMQESESINSPEKTEPKISNEDKKFKKVNGYLVEVKDQNEEPSPPPRTTYDGPGANRRKVDGYWVDKKE